jgi:hypothetical protein
VTWVSFSEPPSVAGTAAPAVDAGQGRVGRALTLAGFTAFTGYVYLLDPDKGGAYPLCPSRVLLGLDCPACGGLRGTNALLHGRVREALDHNLLLPLLLGAVAVGLGSWMLPLIGRPERHLRVPRWLVVTLGAVVVAFTVARNLPGFDFLASDA